MPSTVPPLWKCPKCGERFVTRNMWHSCGKFTLEALFARSEPHVLALFNKFGEMIRSCGPVTMIPQKDPRRVSSASAIRRMLSAKIASGLRVYSKADLDADVQRWMREAYEVGGQKHLKR